MKFKRISALILTTALFITGCASAKGNNVEETNAGVSSSDLYPITIQHAYGETIIEKKPENVVTISWGNHDVPLALGIIPAGVSKANYGQTYWRDQIKINATAMGKKS
jgi:iron complex transport system substrate-binding protein